MQLLDMVLACPSWCKEEVARRFGVVDVSSRSSHLETWYIFLHDLVSGSLVFGVWVLFSVCRALDSSGDDLVYGRNAWFDSGYIFCVSIGVIVDIPASVRGVSGSLQFFPPEHNSAQRTASQIADIPGFWLSSWFSLKKGYNPFPWVL